MPRFPRVVVSGCAHHVTQRGNARRDVFFTAADRRVYCNLLGRFARQYQLDVLGFCLMTNHVHLVVVPETEKSLAMVMRNLQMRYSQYRHAIDGDSGHIWQCRYYSCPVENAAINAVLRYVELNPVRAGLVAEAEDYAWSSARAHLGAPDESGLLNAEEWTASWTVEDWRAVLRGRMGDPAGLRAATFSGRPYGSMQFVRRLEERLGRRLAPGQRGRPRKTDEEESELIGKCSSVPIFQEVAERC